MLKSDNTLLPFTTLVLPAIPDAELYDGNKTNYLTFRGNFRHTLTVNGLEAYLSKEKVRELFHVPTEEVLQRDLRTNIPSITTKELKREVARIRNAKIAAFSDKDKVLKIAYERMISCLLHCLTIAMKNRIDTDMAKHNLLPSEERWNIMWAYFQEKYCISKPGDITQYKELVIKLDPVKHGVTKVVNAYKDFEQVVSEIKKINQQEQPILNEQGEFVYESINLTDMRDNILKQMSAHPKCKHLQDEIDMNGIHKYPYHDIIDKLYNIGIAEANSKHLSESTTYETSIIREHVTAASAITQRSDVKDTHIAKDSDATDCPVCGLMFKTPEQRSKHYNEAHNKKQFNGYSIQPFKNRAYPPLPQHQQYKQKAPYPYHQHPAAQQRQYGQKTPAKFVNKYDQSNIQDNRKRPSNHQNTFEKRKSFKANSVRYYQYQDDEDHTYSEDDEDQDDDDEGNHHDDDPSNQDR
jgi:hypothetical protein